MPRYNDSYKVKHDALTSQNVMVKMSYSELLLVANALEDLHREADIAIKFTDQEIPMHGYPAAELEPAHRVIRDRFVNCALSLEAMHEAN